MYKREDKEFIIDMFLACNRILEYTAGLSYDDFVYDHKTVDAVVRNIEILGEAAKNVSEFLRNKYSKIGWSKIARTRDKLIHAYFGVDEEVIWDIVKRNIPRLFEELKDIIESENWNLDIDF